MLSGIPTIQDNDTDISGVSLLTKALIHSAGNSLSDICTSLLPVYTADEVNNNPPSWIQDSDAWPCARRCALAPRTRPRSCFPCKVGARPGEKG